MWTGNLLHQESARATTVTISANESQSNTSGRLSAPRIPAISCMPFLNIEPGSMHRPGSLRRPLARARPPENRVADDDESSALGALRIAAHHHGPGLASSCESENLATRVAARARRRLRAGLGEPGLAGELFPVPRDDFVARVGRPAVSYTHLR